MPVDVEKNSSMTKVEKMEWRERERREKEMREGGREGGGGGKEREMKDLLAVVLVPLLE